MFEYNPMEIGIRGDAVSQLEELAYTLDQEGYAFDKVSMLKDVADELYELRRIDGDKETFLSKLVESDFDLKDMEEIKDLAVEIYQEVYRDEKDQEVEVLTENEKIDLMVMWQSMTVEELKYELRERELKVSGTKDELFERLAEDIR